MSITTTTTIALISLLAVFSWTTITAMSNRANRLRACLRCNFVQSGPEFRARGCPNCEEVLEMTGSTERVQECTSGVFDGIIAMVKPEESWVAKWQRIGE